MITLTLQIRAKQATWPYGPHGRQVDTDQTIEDVQDAKVSPRLAAAMLRAAADRIDPPLPIVTMPEDRP